MSVLTFVRSPLRRKVFDSTFLQESKSASVSCSVVGGTGGTDNIALLVSVIVRSEFDESTYDFKLPDVTTVADGSRLQDMVRQCDFSEQLQALNGLTNFFDTL